MTAHTAAECFTMRQYSDTTVEGIHRDLLKNRKSRVPGTWEHNRLAIVREEMERRGLKVQNKNFH